jgi:hypothetical protein
MIILYYIIIIILEIFICKYKFYQFQHLLSKINVLEYYDIYIFHDILKYYFNSIL